MAPNPTIMQAVEKLDYRVTVGDVATQAGLDVNIAQQGLLALASEASGHLQVAETGDVVYVFPRNFRSILRNKYLQLRIKEWWEKVWRVVFYLIRISFGIVLVGLIVLAVVAIAIALMALNSSREGNDQRDSGGGFYMPGFWFDPGMIWWIFYPDYDSRRYQYHQRAEAHERNQMNFLEAVFSFLFGDGNPNADLEDRRWQTIGTVIRNNQGAVVAEQIAPYLDQLGQGYALEYEEYMLPVLSRFNGRPEVSPEGGIVYHFPELQTTVKERRTYSVAAYLRELPRRFSNASSGQIMLAASLGAVLFVLALVLASLTGGAAATLSGASASFVKVIAGLSLGYGTAYLAIPLIRYFWVQWRNGKINDRNEARQARAMLLNQADEAIQQKISYAQQFAAETIVRDEDLVYTTETDLLEQEVNRKDQIDAEWERRLQQGH